MQAENNEVQHGLSLLCLSPLSCLAHAYGREHVTVPFYVQTTAAGPAPIAPEALLEPALPAMIRSRDTLGLA